jgi:hypothetical protein
MRQRTQLVAFVLGSLLFTVQVRAHQGEPPASLGIQALADTPIATLTLAGVDPEKLLKEDALHPMANGKTGALRFALPADLQITPETHGTWKNVAGGRLWRLKVEASGATDLNFGFGHFRLPPGAKLYVLSREQSYYQGPYTEAHAHEGQLWTPVIPGAKGIIELFVPENAEFQPELELVRVGRGYRNVFELGFQPLSGSCNVDVACPLGNGWQDQIRAAAVYGTNGSTFCSGTLINNLAQDHRPFFITANHCGLNSGNASSVVVYWNFESPQCGQHGGGTLSDNTSGATFRGSDTQNDFALIELSSIPAADYHVYYAGWDARPSLAPGSSIGIHHPNTDEKSISYNDDPLTTGNSCIGSGGVNSHWIVNNWEQGTTEPGSSGSGLFDPASKRLIGYLSGGSASCSNPSGSDCYGKLAVGFTRGLSTWLDPNHTGTEFVDGLDSDGSNPNPNPDPDPGVTDLTNPTNLTGLSGAAGSSHNYRIQVPAGATNLQIAISGGSGDADLYTRFGSQPTTSTYLCRPYTNGNSESCPVAAPSAGYYYISINAYAAYANLTLKVSYTVGSQPGDGWSQTNMSASKGQWKHFTLDVPSGATSLSAVMSGGTGDADLYVRFNAQPTTSSYNCRPYKNGNAETCSIDNPQAGTWYISVQAYATFSGVRLDASYE